ncbi:DUF2933 domain-containing protein [Halonatronum saccharophilum]|uniref:DUF2933 domain-containing protein n=1 Tax=Halonatronum saccharophilum TaxID=150060 RepID=UPI0004ADED08|nr:DUF2933 domain-containing protein [Halonatronum saccharophilum]
MSKKKSNHSHGHGGHMWMMLVCCLLMFGGIWLFGGLGSEGAGINSSWIFFLICPIMHIFMMKGMMKDDHCKKEDEEQKDCH